MAREGALVTYGRRKRRALESDWDDNVDDDNKQASPPPPPPLPPAPTHSGVPKCRQYFLDFGQTDFTCSTCKICGLLYARGHSEDERLHACFHKCYLHGVSFKGWQRERIVAKIGKDDGRVILVLHSDPLQHQLKVKEMMKIMEKELGIEPSWLLHDRCKVYMYIHLKKVVGCAVTESISQAYQSSSKTSIAVTRLPRRSNGLQLDVRQCWQPNMAGDCLPSEEVISGSKCKKAAETCTAEGEKAIQGSSERALVHGQRTLVFGDVKFVRERTGKQRCERALTTAETPTVCMKASVAAVCGIRGLWVSKSERRRGIATRLLDAVRSSFVYGLVLEECQCAFSQPTSDGRAFAAKYCKTDSYLVY